MGYEAIEVELPLPQQPHDQVEGGNPLPLPLLAAVSEQPEQVDLPVPERRQVDVHRSHVHAHQHHRAASSRPAQGIRPEPPPIASQPVLHLERGPDAGHEPGRSLSGPEPAAPTRGGRGPLRRASPWGDDAVDLMLGGRVEVELFELVILPVEMDRRALREVELDAWVSPLAPAAEPDSAIRDD